MDGECYFLNPLQRDGTSQRQRLVEALHPAFIPIDERGVSDLLLYAKAYASYLRHYTPANMAAGDWVEFIAADISTLVSEILHFDHDEIRRDFAAKRDDVFKADRADVAEKFADLFRPIVRIAENLEDWYRNSLEGLALRKALSRLIASQLSDALRMTAGFALRADKLDVPAELIETGRYSNIWALDGVREDEALFPSGSLDSGDEERDAQELQYAVDRLAAVFGTFDGSLMLLVNDAPSYLDETLERYPEHQPHMALFLAFLKLFAHARRQLNGLTARHLDFYYKEVLGLKHRGEEPDQVHAIFELAKNFPPHAVGQGTELKAGKDANGVDVFYATDRELVVNRAVLDAEHGLKTVFVEMTDDDNPGIVKNIYAAPTANSADGMGAKIEDEDGKWETFGGTMMPYATIGFAIASPMFLLAEGDRDITLTFCLSSLSGLLDVFEQELSFEDKLRIIEEELRRNVTVYASGEKEWLPVTVTEVEISYNDDPTSRHVRYHLHLGSEAGPAAAYNKDVFAEGFDTTHPVLKFVLDNEGLSSPRPAPAETVSIADYSDSKAGYDAGALVRFKRQIFQATQTTTKPGVRPSGGSGAWSVVGQSYPYMYFQRMEIEDIEISIDVKGVRNLILENDLGLLNPAKPFHPFGPVPRQGSSFLIGSPEIFQKSLTNIKLHIEWADLPLENFRAHYAEYTKDDGPEIVGGNEYFTMSASILGAGKWKPLEGTAALEALFPLRGHEAALAGATFSPDGSQIVTASEDNTAGLWGAENGKMTALLRGHLGSVVSAAFSPDGSRIVTASEDSTARLWDIRKGEPAVIVLEGHEGSVTVAAFSPDGNLVVTASEDNSARLWEIGKEKPTVIVLKGHEGSVVSAAFGPGGELVVTASEDNTARLWEAASGKAVAVLAGHEASVTSAAFSPDGKLVVTASDDGTAGLWEVAKGLMIAELRGHVGSLVDAVFSPDGKRVVTASDDNTARVWDVETYETVSRLIGHSADVTRAAFSPDGARIVTASADKTARIWDPESGKLLSILSGHTGRITSAVFSADGKNIVTASSDSTARLWPVSAEEVWNLPLFEPFGKDDAPQPSHDVSFALTPDDITRDSKLESFDRFDTSLRQGFMRATLDKSFLHAMYPSLLMAAADTNGNPPVPSPPYTPLMASLSFDYEASEKVGYGSKGKADFADRIERLFRIGPFGQCEIYPVADDTDPGDVPIARTPVPDFAVTVTTDEDGSEIRTAEGTLYVGIDKLEPPQNLALLFQVAEGSEDPEEPVQDVVWSFLACRGWVDFKTTEIIADGTNGLLASGVVVLAMPEAMTKTSTILPAGLHWIKASVAEKTHAVPKVIAVHTQTVTASYRNRGNDPGHLADTLPAGTIGKLKNRMAPIKAVSQPYGSFGGRMRESDDAFYVRVSERLRHKGRAVSIFDYERLVLEKFPEVYKVRCINHTGTASEYAAGDVSLVVVPNLRNKNAVDRLQPRLSLNKLDNIREYITERGCQFVNVEVLNPKYEEIRASFKAHFHQGIDEGHYTTELNDDLIGFLSPWLHDDAADLTFGGSIHRSSILEFIEKRPYVDFVTEFQMDHIENGRIHLDVEEAKARTSRSALVSVKQHDINASEDQDVAKTGTVGGIVLNPDQKPANGARVEIGGEGIGREATTGADGLFAFAELPAGKYSLQAQGAAGSSESQTVALEPGGSVEVKLTLWAQTGTVRGIVLNPDGKPSNGARVEIGGEGTGSEATTGADGLFAFAGLPPGRYSLRAQGAAGSSESQTVTLEPGGSAEVELVLVSKTGTVRGIVLNPDGKPSNGARVEIGGDGIGREATTGADGLFAFAELPAGKYSLWAQGAAGSSESQTVRLEPGGTVVVKLILGAQKTGTVRGIVLNPDGKPSNGARVEIGGDGISREATTGVDGLFAFAGLPAGKYSLQAQGAAGVSESQTVALEPGGSVQVTLILGAQKTGTVRGIVLNPDGKPSNGARVEIGGEGISREATTGVDGLFAVAGLPAGKYSLRAQGAAGVSESQTVALEAGSSVQVKLILGAQKTGTVRGIALDADESLLEDRYLGNPQTRELHDTANAKAQCQIDKIPADRRYYFRRTEDAEALGYDYCAYCFGRDRSKR